MPSTIQYMIYGREIGILRKYLIFYINKDKSIQKNVSQDCLKILYIDIRLAFIKYFDKIRFQ